MTRPTLVYVSMLVLFGAGLWLVISVGSILLKAPPDLSGRWELRRPDDDFTSPVQDGTMTVEQSGRYLRVNLDKRSHSVKLVSQRPQQITLSGEGIVLVLTRKPSNRNAYDLEVRGAVQGKWTAKHLDQPVGRNSHATAAPPGVPDPRAVAVQPY